MPIKETKDQNEIKNWAEKFNGQPMVLDYPEAEADKLVLRINFPGIEDDLFLDEGREYIAISWDEFFRIFEEQNLTFEYEPDAVIGTPDWNYRFIKGKTDKNSLPAGAESHKQLIESEMIEDEFKMEDNFI